MADSPGSPLSSLSSEDLDDIKFEDPPPSPGGASTPQMPPSKRRRTGISTWDQHHTHNRHHTPISSVHEQDIMPPPSPSSASISSDTSGELPNSPNTLALLGGGIEDDYSGQGRDQVTVCQWEGCDANDLGHMDALVKHIHDEHIGSRQKKYLCEWSDCTRKGQTHASGYALRAHMRSHTKEKPFYCTLPECDRNFTRSDALAKHMRTVHETEALRPSDPISKHHGPGSTAASTGSSKLPRIKLKLSQPSKDNNTNNGYDGDSKPDTTAAAAANGSSKDSPFEFTTIPSFEPELGFDDHELALDPETLCRILRRQVHWAEQETEKLRQNWHTIEPMRKEAWKEKELIFDDLRDAEIRVFKAAIAAPPPPQPEEEDLERGDDDDDDDDDEGHQKGAANGASSLLTADNNNNNNGDKDEVMADSMVAESHTEKEKADDSAAPEQEEVES
ncbi:hypothetical protein AJ80_03403 [Polytolypa hystricis UAMH7299]|uniref:C2H2-type domain-containing protein n=1 Tax=Polytolypa hystricis (strain UAMH7299) TaxID=1447883 RepID=A0A2B7YGV9_POLH7|nr:hypothetical protein AJ80_03403 [Polytolypa hystricis UAMH7299]